MALRAYRGFDMVVERPVKLQEQRSVRIGGLVTHGRGGTMQC